MTVTTPVPSLPDCVEVTAWGIKGLYHNGRTSDYTAGLTR